MQQRHFERIANQFGLQTWIHRSTDNLAREHIHDGQIQPALTGGDVGNIGHPSGLVGRRLSATGRRGWAQAMTL